jgi:hypothetical protein
MGKAIWFLGLLGIMLQRTFLNLVSGGHKLIVGLLCQWCREMFNLIDAIKQASISQVRWRMPVIPAT